MVLLSRDASIRTEDSKSNIPGKCTVLWDNPDSVVAPYCVDTVVQGSLADEVQISRLCPPHSEKSTPIWTSLR